MIGDTSATRFAMGGAMIFEEHLTLPGRDGAWLGRLHAGAGLGLWRRAVDLRYLLGDTPCAVTGVDIDADNIAWCQASYPARRF